MALHYLRARVLRVAVQVSEHAGEGVDVGVDFGVIAHRLLSSAVLNVDWHNENVHM